MIKTLTDLRNYVRADARSAGVELSLRTLTFNPCFRFTVLLRINEYLLNSGHSPVVQAVPKLLCRRLGVRLGFSVPPNVFDAGLAIVHYGLLVVNPAARVGKNCRIHAGVNIGGAAGLVEPGEGKSASSRAPTIGDDCYIGPGAKIFGGIVVGDGCVIGANAVVNRSFAMNGITIAGVPAKLVAHTGSEGKLRRGAG